MLQFYLRLSICLTLPLALFLVSPSPGAILPRLFLCPYLFFGPFPVNLTGSCSSPYRESFTKIITQLPA